MIVAPAATAATREALVADREAARAYAVALTQRAQERREMRIEELRRADQARPERRDEAPSPRPPARGSLLVDILC
jgi:hypothetical protein